MDVLAALDDDIFDTTSNLDISFCIHLCFVASMHPDFAFVVGYHDLGCPIWRAPVFFHHEIAVDGQLTPLTHRENLGSVSRADHLYFYVRHRSANAVNAFLHWIICSSHDRYWAGFCHSIADCQLGQIQDLMELSHQLRRDAGPRCNASP